MNCKRVAAALLLASASPALLTGCDWMKKKEAPAAKGPRELAAEQKERLRKACASEATYARLKELIFDEAARVRNADARNLDPIAAGSVVRMEDPVVKSRDEALNVTVCTGRFVLELPPGAENAFDGMRRVSADVEYAAQAAVDGSGLVYQMDGAEPIVYRLAAIGLPGTAVPKIALGPTSEPPPAATPPLPAPQEAPPAPPPPAPAAPSPAATPPQPVGRVTVRPSFNCRYAKTRTEKMVCTSPRLAALDREMASLFYALLANANPGTRSHLRRSRDAFLVRREGCGSEACVDSAYRSRMAELRRIAQGG
ncbi:MAG TPA: hypothetical protein VHM92_00560 [Allosphingosinicella sp.]|nr:hypothetical protein [Allosphingosinicella sp.]